MPPSDRPQPRDRAAAPLAAALDAAQNAHAAHARALHTKVGLRILHKRHLVAHLRRTLLNNRLGHLHAATSNDSISAPSSDSPDGTVSSAPLPVAILHPSAPDAARAATRTLRLRGLAGLTSAAFFPLTTPLSTSTAPPCRLAITDIAVVQTTPTDVVATVTVTNDHASAPIADLSLVATTHGAAANSWARDTNVRPITATRVSTLAAGATATLTAHVPAPLMWSRPVSAPLIALRLEYAVGGGDRVPSRRVVHHLSRHPLGAPDPDADDAVADPRADLAPHQLLHSVTMDVTVANLPKAAPLTTVVCELLARIDPDALHLQIVRTDHDAWRVVSGDRGRGEAPLLVADVRPSPAAHARLVVGSMSAHTLADTVAHWSLLPRPARPPVYPPHPSTSMSVSATTGAAAAATATAAAVSTALAAPSPSRRRWAREHPLAAAAAVHWWWQSTSAARSSASADAAETDAESATPASSKLRVSVTLRNTALWSPSADPLRPNYAFMEGAKVALTRALAADARIELHVLAMVASPTETDAVLRLLATAGLLAHVPRDRVHLVQLEAGATRGISPTRGLTATARAKIQLLEQIRPHLHIEGTRSARSLHAMAAAVAPATTVIWVHPRRAMALAAGHAGATRMARSHSLDSTCSSDSDHTVVPSPLPPQHQQASAATGLLTPPGSPPAIRPTAIDSSNSSVSDHDLRLASALPLRDDDAVLPPNVVVLPSLTAAVAPRGPIANAVAMVAAP
ncbi:hypothetical protein GGF32_002351 [Allomyces javanicus]|nr:hypothetical protein GGF32_002343 [Allomyces javanicus]KAJ3354878.1 hypothetical protein GGF32_002351 [Allomyces javanicus]